MNFTIDELRNEPNMINDVRVIPNLDLLMELKLLRVRDLPLKIEPKDQEAFLINMRKDVKSIIEAVDIDDFWPLSDGALTYFWGKANFTHRMKFYSVFCVFVDIVRHAQRETLEDMLISACIAGELNEFVEGFYVFLGKEQFYYQRFVKYQIALPLTPF
jgi:hypothetical protein